MERDGLVKKLRGAGLPRHVGIIMDGNGRWAQSRGLPRNMGHRAGADVFGKITRFARDCGIPFLTFYTFSTENWKRPEGEVRDLMALLHKYLKESYKYKQENIKTVFLGDFEPLEPGLRREMRSVAEASSGNTGITVAMAINYGGRNELARAARTLCRAARAGEIDPEAVDEGMVASCLDTAGMPDCDVIIRPSGELRTSNFLIWQAAYAELVFMDILWPDFTEADFTDALLEYARRNRRFGGV